MKERACGELQIVLLELCLQARNTEYVTVRKVLQSGKKNCSGLKYTDKACC